MRAIIPLIFFHCSLTVNAQHIYVCKSENEPQRISTHWVIKGESASLLLVFENGEHPLDNPVKILVEKKRWEGFDMLDTLNLKSLEPGEKASISYSFEGVDSYRLRAQDYSGKELDSILIEIVPWQEHITSTWYKGALLSFREKSENDSTSIPFDYFPFTEKGKGTVEVILETPKEIKTFLIKVDIWEVEKKEIPWFVKTKDLYVEEEWKRVKFTHEVTGTGTFRFLVYNNDGVFISEGILKVK